MGLGKGPATSGAAPSNSASGWRGINVANTHAPTLIRSAPLISFDLSTIMKRLTPQEKPATRVPSGATPSTPSTTTGLTGSFDIPGLNASVPFSLSAPQAGSGDVTPSTAAAAADPTDWTKLALPLGIGAVVIVLIVVMMKR